MALANAGFTLAVGPRDLTFVPVGEVIPARAFEAVRCYAMYKTFLRFNEISGEPVPATLPAQADPLLFTIRKLVTHETPIEGGIEVRHSDAPETLAVTSEELLRFLEVLDAPLAFALTCYLEVKEPRYVLGDYYKAVESIRNALGGISGMLKALGPRGITKAKHSHFGQLCNDTERSPSELSRHAPVAGAPLRRVNWRDPFSDRAFISDFASATTFCREVIDAYILHRAQAGS
jgi:hypothetical protein